MCNQDESVGLAISAAWGIALRSKVRGENYLRWEAVLNQLAGIRCLCVCLSRPKDEADYLWSLALHHQLNNF